MTVYSNPSYAFDGVKNRKVNEAAGKANRPAIYRANLVILAVLLGTAAVFIFLTNFLTSQKYLLNTYRTEFNQLSANLANNSINTKSNDIGALMVFVQKKGMTETRSAESILEDYGIALSRLTY